MSRRAWLTPDSIPDPAICRVLRIPNDIWIIIAVSGALDALCYAENWEQFGTVSPDDTAYAMQEMLWRYFNDGGACMIGAVIAYATASVPENTLDCDGSTYNRTDYPDLYSVLDSVYIVDADTFTVPDLRSRVAIGAGTGTGLSTYAVGDLNGVESVQLSVAELAAHTHVDVGHTHVDGNAIASVAGAPVVPVPAAIPGIGVTGSGSANLANAGSDTAHENRQPSLALRYCIVAR